MKSVSDLVAEAKVKHNIEERAVKSEPMTEPELNWERCTKHVSEMPANYMILVSEAIEKKLQMKTLKMGKSLITTITTWKFGYEVMLELIENENKAIQKVNYYAFNNFTNTAFIRHVLGGKE